MLIAGLWNVKEGKIIIKQNDQITKTKIWSHGVKIRLNWGWIAKEDLELLRLKRDGKIRDLKTFPPLILFTLQSFQSLKAKNFFVWIWFDLTDSWNWENRAKVSAWKARSKTWKSNLTDRKERELLKGNNLRLNCAYGKGMPEPGSIKCTEIC